MNEAAMLLVFVVMIVIPLIGLALLISVHFVKTRHGERREMQRRLLVVIGTVAVAFSLMGIVVATAISVSELVQRDLDLGEAITALAAIALSAVMTCAGVAGIRVSRALSTIDSGADSDALVRQTTTLKRLGWTFVFIPLLFYIPALIVGLVVPIFLLVTLFVVFATHVRAQQAHLLWLLALAVEKGIPLPEEIEAHGSSLKWWSNRRKTLELAELLREGESLPEALNDLSGLVPRFAVVAATVGAETDTMSTALRDAAVRHSQALQQVGTASSAALFFSYFWILISVTLSLVWFQMYYIVPKFKQIYESFGVELPAITISLIQVSDFTVTYFYIALPVLALPCIFVVFIGIGFLYGWGNLNLPWLTWWFPRFDTPWILRNLATAITSKHPLTSSLYALSAHQRRVDLRDRIERIAADVTDGENCWDCLLAEHLIDQSELSVLRSAQRVGNLTWALRRIADTVEELQTCRLLYCFEFLRPVLVLLVGFVVAFITLGMFMPLIKLLNDLT